MSPATQKIIDQINKLQALAGDAAATGREAANAAEHIQRLLFKHNLTMHEVRQRTKGPAPRYDKFKVDLGSKANSRVNSGWKLTILSALAKTNFCRVVMFDKETYVMVIGQPDSIEVVHRLWSYIVKELASAKTRWWQETKADYAQRGLEPTRKKYMLSHRSFLEHAAYMVYRRVWDLYAKMKVETENSTALVVQSDKEVEEALKKFYPDLKEGRKRRAAKVDFDAAIAGQAAGKNVRIAELTQVGE